MVEVRYCSPCLPVISNAHHFYICQIVLWHFSSFSCDALVHMASWGCRLSTVIIIKGAILGNVLLYVLIHIK